MTPNPQQSASPEDRFLVFFDRIVLCRYRSRPDLFDVDEDDMGGELKTRCSAGGSYFRIRFGFRELADGRVCVAAFGPDLESLPEPERLVWAADLIDVPLFATNDPAFTRWSHRYLRGSWNSRCGPLRTLERELELIAAITRLAVDEPLFRDTRNPALRYPVAENTEALTLALLEMYRLVVDGLSPDSLQKLSDRLGIKHPEDRSKTLNTLKKMLPRDLETSVYKPLRDCARARNRIHGVPSSPPHTHPAFRDFHASATAICKAIQELRSWLETALGLDAKECLRREQVMAIFPRFDRPLRPNDKYQQFQKAAGKTITSIEAGEVLPSKNCHNREALILHFSDGTSLAIDVGSNAGNFEAKGLAASDFSTDLVPVWAPDPRRDPENSN